MIFMPAEATAGLGFRRCFGGSFARSNPTEQMYRLFPDQDDWSIQTLRLIAEGQFGGADINECVRTAERLGGKRDVESWCHEWSRTASEVANWARSERSKSHESTAQQGFFRAFNYYRTADFFLDPENPR